jgi:hypothetical protein
MKEASSMKKVLNLHGIDGKSKNYNSFLLAMEFSRDSIISPQIDYRNTSLQEVLGIADDIFESEEIGLVVGNSFGGFIAACGAFKHNVPYILTNPCLRPDISIDSIVPGYAEANRSDIAYNLNQLMYDRDFWSRGCIIFGDEDEVLDTELSRKVISKGACVVTIPGGHRLRGNLFDDVFFSLCHRATGEEEK